MQALRSRNRSHLLDRKTGCHVSVTPFQATNTQSGADGDLQGLAGRNDLTAIVVTAVAAHMVRTLQFTTVSTLGMGLRAQGLMAATHAATGR
ncbi:hypothetical protein AA0472_2006 [Acetobacter estunensis NRIC 0472]|nr:hypothetical protein AA0472_2006 [Acetobacter estunensis NRIC 0472]